MLIRREVMGDAPAVARVHRQAFGLGTHQPVEVELLAALRVSPDWLGRLSLVAEVDTTIVGHVVCSRGTIAASPVAVGLGPLGVLPDWQEQGIGSALVHAVVAAAEATDLAAVLVLGDPAFYRRLGFVPAEGLGIQSPDPSWGAHFQGRLLTTGVVRGRFAYAAPFATPTETNPDQTADLPGRPRQDDGTSIVIRTARASDHADLVELNIQTWDRGSSPGPKPDRTRDFFDRRGPQDHLVALTAAGDLIGYVSLGQPTSLDASKHVMQVQGLGVHPDHRQQGIARLLLEAVIDRARKEGRRKVSLRVMGGNVVAQRLYADLGFIVEGRLREEFLIDGDPVDDLFLSRFLS